MMKNSFRKRRSRPNLSATFRRNYKASGIVTLDEALALIDRKNKQAEAIAFRDKDVVKKSSQKQIFALSKGGGGRRTIKMPEFSILKKDE